MVAAEDMVIRLKKIVLDNNSTNKTIRNWSTQDYKNFIKKTEARGTDVVEEFCKSMGIH